MRAIAVPLRKLKKGKYGADDPVKVIRAITSKKFQLVKDMKSQGRVSNLFDPDQHFFDDTLHMEKISYEFDKIFEWNSDNSEDYVYNTLKSIDFMGYLPFSFAIPPHYWKQANIEGYTEKTGRAFIGKSLYAIKNMELLLHESSTTESNDDFTTTENRFDSTLVKHGYYYLLTLPYMQHRVNMGLQDTPTHGIFKDTPLDLAKDSIDAKFIETAT